jgi:hypothetical protein
MAIDLTSNTIAQYKMNDNSANTVVIDSARNYNGMYGGANTDAKSVVGVINTALSFNGINNYIDTNQTFQSTLQNSFSINLWCKDIGEGTNQQHFVAVSWGLYILEFFKTGTTVGINYTTQAPVPVSAIITNTPLTSWSMVTAVVENLDGSNTRALLYINGDLVKIGTTMGIPMSDWGTVGTNLNVYVGCGNIVGHAIENFDGYLDDVRIFNKVLTVDEISFLYNDGTGTELSSSGNIDLISAPSIIYPNGGETFTEGDINIQWVEPGNLSTTELIWYEIFITDDYDPHKKSELIQIATIPSGNTSYSYTIQKNLKGTRSRIGIRATDSTGLRSNMSFSADYFIITNESLPSPSMIEPVKGDTYFSYVPFIFDHNAVMGRSSQRSFYQIYYKSDNQDLDWTLLKSNIMVGSDPINIDVSNFITNSDYVFKIELVDGDNVSSPVFIDNININNINLFLIDTTPPSGTVRIVDNEEYTKDKSLILRISASDEVTFVKDVQIQQTNTQSQLSVTGEYVPLTPLLTWDIKEEIAGGGVIDGVKLIQARFRDYGGNTVTASQEKYFRTYKNLENREVTSLFYDHAQDNLYFSFAGDLISSASAELYRNLTFISTLDGDATALEVYNNVLYVAIKDDENKGILQRLTGGSINTIADNEDEFLDVSETVINSLYSADSVINAMEVFDNVLFLGLDNGEILSFKGATVSSENDDYLNLKSVRNIRTDGIMLYIFFYNTTEMLVMSQDSSGDYVFSTVDTEN